MSTNGRDTLVWDDLLRGRLEHARKEKERAEAEAKHWAEYAAGLEAVARLEEERRTLRLTSGTNVDPLALSNTSIRNALVTLARNNGDRVITRDAIKVLRFSGLFTTDAAARDNVYSTLSKSSEFHKEGRGVWRLVPPDERKTFTKPLPLSIEQSKPATQGLVRKVELLLILHPGWKHTQVLEQLKNDGWSFGASNPAYAVSAAFASIARKRNHLARKAAMKATPFSLQPTIPQASL